MMSSDSSGGTPKYRRYIPGGFSLPFPKQMLTGAVGQISLE